MKENTVRDRRWRPIVDQLSCSLLMFVFKQCFKTESTSKLSNLNFQRTKTLHQNYLK